jgi:hypothetical protein
MKSHCQRSTSSSQGCRRDGEERRSIDDWVELARFRVRVTLLHDRSHNRGSRDPSPPPFFHRTTHVTRQLFFLTPTSARRLPPLLPRIGLHAPASPSLHRPLLCPANPQIAPNPNFDLEPPPPSPPLIRCPARRRHPRSHLAPPTSPLTSATTVGPPTTGIC